MLMLDRFEVKDMLQRRLRTLVTVVCLSCVVALSLGCDSTCRPERDTNLIDNGSFEINRKPSLAGWTLLNPDLAETVNDGAPGSGFWSLKLSADWAPTMAVVWQKVEGTADGDVLTLTAYVKAYEGGGGIIRLVSGSHPLEQGPHPWASSDSTDWVRLALTDTLALSPGDSVWVVLSSFHTEISERIGLFDDVRVVRDGE
jgi:hypothetical protein